MMRRPRDGWRGTGRALGVLAALCLPVLSCLLALLCLPAVVCLPLPAQAHPQFALSTVNRYGKLVLQSPRQGRLFFTLMVGDAPAHALRQRADRNGDGTLDDGEQQALAAALRERVQSGVHLYRGEAELPLPWEPEPFRLDSPEVVAKAFAYEMSAPLALTVAPTDELRYDDLVELAPVGEIELRIEEGPGMRVLHAESQVTQPAPPPPGGSSAIVFQWYGPPRSSLSDRSVRVRFAAAEPSGRSRQPPRPFLAGRLGGCLAIAGLVAAGLGGALWARRRRRVALSRPSAG
jgi:hypothetical protein